MTDLSPTWQTLLTASSEDPFKERFIAGWARKAASEIDHAWRFHGPDAAKCGRCLLDSYKAGKTKLIDADH